MQLQAGRGWINAAAAVGRKVWKRERVMMIQVRSQGSRPGEGTGVWAGVENSSWDVGETGVWLEEGCGWKGGVAGMRE